MKIAERPPFFGDALFNFPVLRAGLTSSRISPRFAAKTIDAVSFTSNEGSSTSLLPCKLFAATFMPGDSSIGMNVAAKSLQGNKLVLDPSFDVNETASIVLAAKRGLIRDDVKPARNTGKLKSASPKKGGRSAIFILGGGSPKNFALQTEPQIQEVLGIDERGHDYFLQVTDARPDTGGLSGATPGEAVSWGKVDPDRLPDAVVCYLDSTVALPIITAYALAKHKPRNPRRLYERREEFMKLLLSEYQKSRRR